jgi:methylated-DNA-[protein]-cysteine S-methyltransferase
MCAAEFDAVLKTPFGALGVECTEEIHRQIRFLPPGTRTGAENAAGASEAVRQLRRLAGDPARVRPAARAGRHAFQRSVWRAIAAIPAGRPDLRRDRRGA